MGKNKKQKEKIYYIRISEREFMNGNIKKAFFDFLNLKFREQRGTPYIIMTSSEFELLRRYRSSFFTPWIRYAKSRKELKYPENEVGKYLGKRLRVELGLVIEPGLVEKELMEVEDKLKVEEPKLKVEEPKKEKVVPKEKPIEEQEPIQPDDDGYKESKGRTKSPKENIRSY